MFGTIRLLAVKMANILNSCCLQFIVLFIVIDLPGLAWSNAAVTNVNIEHALFFNGNRTQQPIDKAIEAAPIVAASVVEADGADAENDIVSIFLLMSFIMNVIMTFTIMPFLGH